MHLLFPFLFVLVQLQRSSQLDRGVNLALGKPAYQSSTLLQGVASNAVDGYRHPNYFKESCIYTNLGYEPWWYVDLEGTYYVTSVRITNRGDCCFERLTNFEIKVGESDMEGGIRNRRCAPRFSEIIDAGKTVEIECTEPFLGRYVTVVIPGNAGILNFCEVEVYGREPSSVLRLKLISYGFGETGSDRKPYSRLYANSKSYSFMSKGFNFKLYNIETGTSTSYETFDTNADYSADDRLKTYLQNIPDGYVVCMVLFLSGNLYYKKSLPYMEELLGQSITADVKHGETWVFLGYKGIHSPIPHWRESIRKNSGKGPALMTKLVTLRKAPSGKPTNVNIVAQNGSSIKVTWTRPHDYLRDDDYPFDYYLCINNTNYHYCAIAVKKLHYIFQGLQPSTTYSISLQAMSFDMIAEAAVLTVSTIESDATVIKVKLISRVMEDAFYRVNEQPHSSIVVSGDAYNFKKHGHNFVVLDALTGGVVQTASFNTYEVPHSGSNMASFVSSLPDKVIILMVVFYRAHVYYDAAAASLVAVCPNAPLLLEEHNSNTLICLKGIGQPSWTASMVSSYSIGSAVTERNILLPKDLSTFPTITKVVPSSSSLNIEWFAPVTNNFTGKIEHYELCYKGDFNINGCDKVDATNLKWTTINLHPWVEYEIKIRAATLLGYGPFSARKNATTLPEAPSGPPENITIKTFNESSIHLTWLPPARVHQNGIITGFSVCLKELSPSTGCLYTINCTADQPWAVLADLAPFIEHTIEIKARTAIGYGPSMTIKQRTSVAAPYGPPVNLSFIFINATCLKVAWDPPELVLRNGIITKYSICVRNDTSSFIHCQPVVLPGTMTNYTILGLSPYTIYDVIISAATSVGFGPTAIVVNRTSQAAPSRPPSSFQPTFHNSTTVALSWVPPEQKYHNGILTKYGLTISPAFPSSKDQETVFLDGANNSYLATNLRPFVNYYFELRAATVAGFGPAVITNATTSMAAPSGASTLVVATNITSTTFQITWSPPVKEKRNGIIILYSLCIREFGVLFACNDTRNVSSSQKMFLFTGLNPNKEYLVEIKAATKIGFGPPAFVQKMAGKCDNALVDDPVKIPNSQFSASSYLGEGHEPYQARFTGLQIWCAHGSKTSSYLEIDIGTKLRVLAVATQGDMRHFTSWVRLYKVLYKTNSSNWTAVTVSGEEAIQGNNGEGVVKHYLDNPVTARYVRFVILGFVGEHSCMRVEIFGCTPAVTPESISVVSWNSSSIEVSWKPSKEPDANGDILGYVICAMQPLDTSCRQNITYLGRDSRQQLFTALKPFTNYVIKLSSYNVAGVGSVIEIQQRTLETAPSSGPETIEVLATTTNTMKIFWSEIKEEDKNGIIIKYSLCYKEHESEPETDHNCTDFRELLPSPRIFLLENLQPFTEYVLVMKAATSIGWGPQNFLIHRTLSAPPSGPPTAVSIHHLGATILQVIWSPPETEKRNGVIIGYSLCAQDLEENGRCLNLVNVNGSARAHAISGLKPFTMYSVSVEARTEGGYGPSEVFHHRTGESIPSGAPTDISVSFANETSITVTWKSPEIVEVNGILTSHLVVIHEQLSNGNLRTISNATVPHSTFFWIFNNLKVKTEYIIEVRSGTKIGLGPPAVVHQMTAGQADVTYVKKSNKTYLALAKAGITAGALSVIFLVGFFIFVSLLVMGYIPRTKPWVKRRRLLWRNKIEKQNEERRKRESSDESEFESDSESSNNSGSSGNESSSDSEKVTKKKKRKAKKEVIKKGGLFSKKKFTKNRSKTSQKKTKNKAGRNEQSGGKIVEEGPNVDMYGSRPEDIVIAARSVKSRIYTGTSKDIYGSRRAEGIHGEDEDIYGSVYGGAPRDIYGSRIDINGGTPGDIYGPRPDAIYGGAPKDNYGPRPADISGGAVEDIYGPVGAPRDIYGVGPEDIYGQDVMTNMYIRSVMDMLAQQPQDHPRTMEDIYGTHSQYSIWDNQGQ